MNIKDLVAPLLLAVSLTIIGQSAVNYFWPAPKSTEFIAPISKKEQEPLYLEVDFIDNEKEGNEAPIKFTTKHGEYIFSSQGGTLQSLDFFRERNGKSQVFNTIGTTSHIERETRSFLVALDSNTPYNYTLKNQKELENAFAVTYKADTDTGTIEKEFIVYKDTYKMDVVLTVNPKKGQLMRPRLIFASPFLQILEGQDFVNAFSIDKSGSYSKKAQAKINQRVGYFSPQVFGTENKYFIHSMVTDADDFVERAYYKVIGGQVSSFLEGPRVEEKTTWTVSFYMGPKESQAIKAVAPSLDKTLDYGFLSPLTKGVLHILKILNNYFGDYGIAIILVTILLKLLFLPLTFMGENKMKKVQEHQKQMSYIEQRYKHNPEMKKQAQEDFIKENGFPPLVGGCLPVILQLPMFWVLSAALNNSIELYKAPFVFWIDDLSIPDPYYVLPFLAFAGFAMSILFSGEKLEPKKLFVMFGVGLLISGLISNMSAGLGLYMVVSGLLQVLQKQAQKVIG